MPQPHNLLWKVDVDNSSSSMWMNSNKRQRWHWMLRYRYASWFSFCAVQCPKSAKMLCYYSDGIMSAMASQIISVSIVCSTVCSEADQRKYQSSAPLALQMATNAESICIWWRFRAPFISTKSKSPSTHKKTTQRHTWTQTYPLLI